ncbi:T9SS type A sorting domain-containing protein [Aureivirga sp. CE67]|uniref:T9SS type A sorting domain-containing protein n=1 Tax=Aureivirga sp. CE67 TaxID=1788983 RepID=UPI0018CBE96A|nr:T9SS type A sorting domain-containing protein [Aureivirga sp. CE67]
MKKIQLLVFILLSNFCFSQEIQFTEYSTPVNYEQNFDQFYYCSVSISDIDGDNDNDIIFAGADTNNLVKVSIYLNDGSGNYVLDENTSFLGLSRPKIDLSDIDNDNDLDIIISGYDLTPSEYKNKILVYKNDGNGNFEEHLEAFSQEYSCKKFVVNDFNNDDFNDILVYNGIAPKILFNDGSGTFEESSFDFNQFNKCVAEDFDNDGDIDLVAKFYHLNDGSGNFVTNEDFTFKNTSLGSINSIDFDNDGDFDIIITGRDNQQVIVSLLYLNDGNGNFTEENSPFEPVYQSKCLVLDIDHDNDDDFIISGINENNNTITKLYINNQNGNFIENEDVFFEGVAYSSISYDDIENDDDIDILITGLTEDDEVITKLYKNTTGEVVSVEENSVDFFELLPNPASNILKIKTEKQINKLVIYDTSGKIIMDNNNFRGSKIDISKFTSGTYFIKVDFKDSSIIKQLVIE